MVVKGIMEKCNISECSLYEALKELNSRWVPFVLLELKDEQLRFTDLQKRFDFLTSTQLSRSLNKCINSFYITNENQTYQLTQKGFEIVGVLELLEQIDKKYKIN